MATIQCPKFTAVQSSEAPEFNTYDQIAEDGCLWDDHISSCQPLEELTLRPKKS